MPILFIEPNKPPHALTNKQTQADRELEEREKREAEAKAAAEAAAKKKAVEDAARREKKRAALGPEPTEGEVCRIAVRLPQGGKPLQRSFLATDTLESVFDWVDVEGLLDPGATRLVQTRPKRRAYAYPDDKGLTLAEAGLSGQVLLLVESSAASR